SGTGATAARDAGLRLIAVPVGGHPAPPADLALTDLTDPDLRAWIASWRRRVGCLTGCPPVARSWPCGADPVFTGPHEHIAGPVHPPVRPRPRLRPARPRLAEHRGRRARPRVPAREDRAAGLLDLLLCELPARARRAAAPGGEVGRRAGGDRGPLPEVRVREGPRRAGREHRAVRGHPSGDRRPGPADLERVRRPCLAHPDGAG